MLEDRYVFHQASIIENRAIHQQENFAETPTIILPEIRETSRCLVHPAVENSPMTAQYLGDYRFPNG